MIEHVQASNREGGAVSCHTWLTYAQLIASFTLMPFSAFWGLSDPLICHHVFSTWQGRLDCPELHPSYSV
jgi:hypothetical protein